MRLVTRFESRSLTHPRHAHVVLPDPIGIGTWQSVFFEALRKAGPFIDGDSRRSETFDPSRFMRWHRMSQRPRVWFIECGGLQIADSRNGPEVGLRPTPFAPIIRPAPSTQRVKSSRLRIAGRSVRELQAEPPRNQIDLPETSLQGCIPSDRIPAGGFS